MPTATAPTLVLIDVRSPVREAFEHWAYTRHMVVTSSLASGDSVCLCAIEVGSADDLEFLENRLPSIRKSIGFAPTVVLARQTSVRTAVGLMRAGIANIIELPGSPTQIVSESVAHALGASLNAGNVEIVGRSEPMLEMRAWIEAVAAHETTVLITGETGTGKGLVAQVIHGLSSRRDQLFIHVDCGALASSVFESELFGYERGSFTGASASRPGLFEAAGDGTIFLDEIGEIPIQLQAKLLRVLNDRVYFRIGGREARPVRARILAATNRDLEAEAREGRFRSDLLFRLNALEMEIPPLRARRDDIPDLVHHHLTVLSARLGLRAPVVTDDFLAGLARHDWPGNVRELENRLERMLILNRDDVVGEPALERFLGNAAMRTSSAPGPPAMDSSGPWSPTPEERAWLKAELESAAGNISRVAKRLRIARSTLRYRMATYGLEADRR